MLRLVEEVLNLLSDLIVGWLLPLIISALGAGVISIIIAANPVIGGSVVIVIAALLVVHTVRHQMWWQLAVWLTALLPLAVLAFVDTVWALYWALGLQVLALGILFVIPGAVWPTVRRWITGGLVAGSLLSASLAGVVFTGGDVAVLLLGVILLGASAILFSRAARPFEIRRTQRQTARLLGTLGVILITGAIMTPVIVRVFLSLMALFS